MGDADPMETPQAERVFSAPSDALTQARAVLSDPDSSPPDQARALLELGRSAYYGNQMSDAVKLLANARELATEPELLTEILLALAPAMSKDGAPDEALALLDRCEPGMEPRFAGQLRSYRGIILTEMGRLPEAMEQTEVAVRLLRTAGDRSRETRALVNLAVIASLMGRLDDSDQWYLAALDLATETGQHVVAAGIEGNMGYNASRRGDYARALGWYRVARGHFDDLGNVDLLVAVLDADSARTQLDAGLLGDAAEAAARSARSAAAGGNQMLETQSRLLAAEALIGLGDHASAREQIARAAELADQLHLAPWRLRAVHLSAELDPVDQLDEPASPRDQIDRFLEAGWVREGYEFALRFARRWRVARPAEARSLLVTAEERTRGVDVDEVDRALCQLLLAEIDADRELAALAYDRALAALHRQRNLHGSVELRAALASRAQPIQEAALSVALQSTDRVNEALHVLERLRTATLAPRRHPRPEEGGPDRDQLAALRGARMDLDEAKLGGGDVVAASARVQRLERQLLESGRDATGARATVPAAPSPPEQPIPEGTAYVTFAVHDGHLLGAVRTADGAALHDLGDLRSVGPLIRAQRLALRRLAAASARGPDDHIERLRRASADLDGRVLGPLGLDGAERVVLTPPAALGEVTWSALPTLATRPLTLTPTYGSWHAAAPQLSIGSFALLCGPGLAHAPDELAGIARSWSLGTASTASSTCRQAAAALETADLAHISAHGSFRADNPYFSSLRFDDGHLSLLELSELARVPAMVVLASCDAGAAAATAAGRGGDVTIGTATELLNLGAQVVIAPTVIVDDEAAAAFTVDLHRRLAGGYPVDDAMVAARLALIDAGGPTFTAAALAFHVFGDRSTRRPLLRQAVPDAAGGIG